MMSQSAVDMKKEKRPQLLLSLKKNVKKFMNNKLALLGLLVIVIMTVACIIGAIAGVDYVTPHLPDMKKALETDICSEQILWDVTCLPVF